MFIFDHNLIFELILIVDDNEIWIYAILCGVANVIMDWKIMKWIALLEFKKLEKWVGESFIKFFNR